MFMASHEGNYDIEHQFYGFYADAKVYCIDIFVLCIHGNYDIEHQFYGFYADA